MGGPYAELIRKHQTRLFAFLRSGTSSEHAAAQLFAETFRLMAENGVDRDPDVDPDTMVYRYALRAQKRFDVPPPDAASPLMRMCDVLAPEDRGALALLITSELRLAEVANALRRPEPMLTDALARALVTMTRLEPAAEGAIGHTMVAMDAFGWLTPDDRATITADPTAAPRRAALDHTLGQIRELLPPCEPPDGLLAHTDAMVEKALRASAAEVVTRPRRRTGRMIAIAMGAMVVLGAGGFAAMKLRTTEPAPAVAQTEAEVAVEAAPVPAPSLAPAPPPAIEVAAQGPAAPTDPRIDKATVLARKQQCKKAAKLFAKIVDASPPSMAAATTGLEPCRGWLKKPRSDKQVNALARRLGWR
jgi:hypothetical protein